VQELSLVHGFTPEAVARLQPFVTVYAGQVGAPLSQVNLNTAPRDVLMALDESIDERLAERIMEERRLQPFKAPGELSRVPGAEALAQKLAGKVAVKGTLFRIVASAAVRDSARSVAAVVRVAGSTPEILSWQEY
jgi:general secretion pathway protein K